MDDPLLLIATILLAVGFGFKLAAVPFHMWTPDVYQGAPTSVTAFMAVASKAASFAAFMRVFVEGLGGLKADWSLLFLLISIVTLVLGNVVAIVQTNIKRMLAYSSIAHAGYALIGFVAAGRGVGASGGTPGLASVMIYLALYAFMTLGAFAVIGMLRKGGVEGEEIEDFTGLAKRQPLAAFLMLVFMASLAGIPPTAGFIGKFYVFMAAVEAGLAWLAAIALIFAAVSAYYYMRVVMVMYMRDPNPSSVATPHLVTSPALSFVLACAVAGVISVRPLSQSSRQLRAPISPDAQIILWQDAGRSSAPRSRVPFHGVPSDAFSGILVARSDVPHCGQYQLSSRSRAGGCLGDAPVFTRCGTSGETF